MGSNYWLISDLKNPCIVEFALLIVFILFYFLKNFKKIVILLSELEKDTNFSAHKMFALVPWLIQMENSQLCSNFKGL